MSGADALDFETVLAARAAEVESLPRQAARRAALDKAKSRGRPNSSRQCATACSTAASGCARSSSSRAPPCSTPIRADALTIAAALECVHCYSLIHDDLPAMDDDDLRRGQPTVHKAFDEATAILAGDALLTYAFDILASGDGRMPATARLELVAGLARAAGIGGMAGGQALDLAAEKSRA